MTNPDSEKRITQMMAEANRLWKLEERIRNANKPKDEKPVETPPVEDPPNKYWEYMRRCVQSGTVSDFPGDIQFDAVVRLYDIHLGADGLRPSRNDVLSAEFEALPPDQQAYLLKISAKDYK